jgi:hypothetical protein
MSDDTEVAALRAQLEAIIKEAEDTEAQAATARRHVQAARLLLEEESKATALEQTATTAHQCVSSLSSSSSSPVMASPLVPTTCSTYEDTVIAGLHVQAVTVLNVRQLVNIVLDSSTNYTCGHDLMEHALQCYALIKHITDDTLSNDPRWIQMDSVILNYISNSISVDLHQVVQERSCMARYLWLAIVHQVSNVLFTLMLTFVLLFRVTSWSMSTAASSRPWPTVWLTSAHPLKAESLSSTSFGGCPIEMSETQWSHTLHISLNQGFNG